MTTLTPRLRVAGPTDAETVGNLLDEFNIEFDTPTPGAEVFALRFRRLLALTEVFVLLAEDSDAEPAGLAFLTLRPTPYFDGPLAQLEELYVRPALRNHGIGSALLTEAIEQLRARRCGEMHINVDEIDIDTRRFYERHGFVNIEPGEDYRMLCYLREI
ncbi:GNAT family N-acetyltransferase [Nocardia beijingensis]|uniref:GNAT family N-acetyltransferase n=1 Tax=Nocardia beijingensis TaxID=95162 RepID=UPI0018942272|nr:GNAT family N-acetyltransferase [Nocardia beijingensis]MBF6468498.1 GNAT family N-acetyltransferase [Nocardia beijingensis]